MLSILLIAAAPALNEPAILIDRDNIEITQSCVVEVARRPIIDADHNGVIHITAEGITVDFANQSLHGSNENQSPDTFRGLGVKITAKNVTLKNAMVSGYKVGIHAINADGLTIHHTDVSNNFHQRLESTPQAEDASDWLWPHHNDDNQWMTNYGAGICVEDSNTVTLHHIRARKTQNGIILDRVDNSKVYDCDCSFLSGWGLAMWRSNRNVISRNAFDFCVRGYSHGVYNRGQDSAGILMFEQCCENIIAENSATHCGDGFFGFAGKEALGEINPREDVEWYTGRGNNRNILWRNDFSYAPAHGIELTFSFGNDLIENTLVGNAICGVWGGYSRESMIADNTIEFNGEMAYGLERGGVNIEHGHNNIIARNALRSNRCGIHLWSDDDGALKDTPWARANKVGSSNELIIRNTFDANEVDVHLRETAQTRFWRNRGLSPNRMDIDVKSRETAELPAPGTGDMPIRDTRADRGHAKSEGVSAPIGARAHLAGREHIIMTQWGPYDWESPVAVADGLVTDDNGLTWAQLRVINPTGVAYSVAVSDSRGILTTLKTPAGNEYVTSTAEGESRMNKMIHWRKSLGNGVHIHRLRADEPGAHSISAKFEDGPATELQVVFAEWELRSFISPVDPRENVEAWRAAAKNAVAHKLTSLDLRFAHGGPRIIKVEGNAKTTHEAKDHFGTIATTSVPLPAGSWRLRTLSDDGIRVWLDHELVIDDWTHHGPTPHNYDFTIEKQRDVTLRVEHFELDGYAILSLALERIEKR